MANSNQTQVVLAQGSDVTYPPVNSKQIATIGSEEKRAFTFLVTLSNDGKLLPFQCIYKGSTSASLPAKDARSMADALAEGFLY
jgi:hypothetical protein